MLVAAGQACAGAFSIDPVRISLSEDKPSAVMRVENLSATSMTLQLQVMSWTQSDHCDQLTHSWDLLATPQVFRLKAGQVQVVRVALLRPVDQRRELAYRLLLDEVPPPPASDFRGLQMALRISMPVFVAPREAAAPALGVRLIERDGQQLLALANRGLAHLQLNSFQLQKNAPALIPVADTAASTARPPNISATHASGSNAAVPIAAVPNAAISNAASSNALFVHEKNLYLLPGQQRDLPLPASLSLPPGEPLTLHAQTPGGLQDFHVPAISR